MNLNEREARSSVPVVAPDLDSKAAVRNAMQYSTDEQLVRIRRTRVRRPGLASAERSQRNRRAGGRPEAEEARALFGF